MYTFGHDAYRQVIEQLISIKDKWWWINLEVQIEVDVKRMNSYHSNLKKYILKLGKCFILLC